MLCIFKKKPAATTPSSKPPAPAKSVPKPTAADDEDDGPKKGGSKKSKKSKKSQKSKKSAKEKVKGTGAGTPAAGGPIKPATGGIAGTHDPNYQTLAGVGGDCFGADKAAGGAPAAGAGGPKPPAAGGMAGTHDPNYQVRKCYQSYRQNYCFRLWLVLVETVLVPTKLVEAVEELLLEEVDQKPLLLVAWLVPTILTIR